MGVLSKYHLFKVGRTAKLFMWINKYDIDPDEFIPRYMKSEAEEIIAEDWSPMDGMSTPYLIDMIQDEIHASIKKEHVYDSSYLEWAGYLYRYWFYYRQVPLAVIADILPFKDLYQYYPAYHTMDLKFAIDRFLE